MSTPRALLLDIGGVVLTSAHERLAALGTARPELSAFTEVRGRLGPRADPAWERVLDGTGSERRYWADRAEQYARRIGDRSERGVPALMEVLYSTDTSDVGTALGHFRSEAVRLIDDARTAGLTVVALTNDLAAFHGDADLTRHPVLGRFDAIVDGSVTGVLKPDPGAFRAALAAVGRAPHEVVFLDDLPGHCAGARALGLVTVEVDPRDPHAAFARARRLLALPDAVRPA